MLEVAIIGLGPWGLSALERLVNGLRTQSPSRRQATVHVVEPRPAGSGVFSPEQPDYFILNTPCGQHSLHPFAEPCGRSGFYDWVQARGYCWVGDRCRIGTSGRAITPDDFLPRRLMGEYLEWFYEELVAGAPARVRVIHHRDHAVDITDIGSRERVHLAGGGSIDVDSAILATGHTANAEAEVDQGVLPAYPADLYASAVKPGSGVAVSGMGLVALDVVIALTRGRGGKFVGEDRLRYRASGHEPVIQLFSRSGQPYRAKSLGTEDPTGEYIPSICTPEAIDEARRRRLRESGSPQLDVRADVLPLIVAEMETRYYEQAVCLRRGTEAAHAAKAELTGAWASGAFAATRTAYGASYGFFDAAATFFDDAAAESISSKDDEAHVYSRISDDLSEALVPGGASPLKAAQEVLRVLRDTMRGAVEFRSLTLASYRDFQAHVRPMITRSITGPPAFRCQQLLALMDADVLRVPFGPSPAVLQAEGGGFQVTSRRLLEPLSSQIDVLIRGHLDDPTVDRSRSPLLRALYESGRFRQLHYGPESVGSIDLSADLNPVNSDGEPQRRLFVLGALTEGARYFTAYIPSPKSRVRAFLDAQSCVERILAAAP